MNIKIDINVCRVCLQTGSGVSLFDTNVYADKFQYATQLTISKADGLPETLCIKCIRKLNVAYDFRKQSEVSDEHLRSFIDEVNKNFNKVTTTTHNSPKDEENQNNNDADLLAILANDDPSQEPPLQLQLQQPPPLPQSTELTAEFASDPESILPTLEEETIKLKVNQIKKEKLQDDSENDDTNSATDYYSEKKVTITKLQEIVEPYEQEDEEEEDDGGYQAVDYEMIDADGDVQFTVETLEFSNNDEADEDDHDETNEMQLMMAADEEENLEEEHLLDNVDNNEPEEEIIRVGIKPLKRNSNSHGNHHFCSKCKKEFSTKTNLVRHMATHDGKRPFKCEICGKCFTQNGSLKQHMFIHTGIRPYVCEYCDRGFTQGKSLVFHMRRHTGEKPFECKECGLNFRQKDGLKRHEAVKHAGSAVRPVFPCDICKKLLSSKYSLSLHVKKHKDNRQDPNDTTKKGGQKKNQMLIDDVILYECTMCTKKFRQKSLFDSHKKIHLIDQYACSYCSKIFSKKSSLLSHVKNHKNVSNNLYECTKCTEKYSVKQDLLDHLKLHENPPPDVDMAAENEQETLFETESLSNVIGGGGINSPVTEYINDGDTIYKCNDCDMLLDTENSLKEHRINEHDDVDDDGGGGDLDDTDDFYGCDECGKEFRNAFDLDTHILADHDEIEESKCGQCSEHFTSLKLFEEHKMEHYL